jgi:hypothetical protein
MMRSTSLAFAFVCGLLFCDSVMAQCANGRCNRGTPKSSPVTATFTSSVLASSTPSPSGTRVISQSAPVVLSSRVISSTPVVSSTPVRSTSVVSTPVNKQPVVRVSPTVTHTPVSVGTVTSPSQTRVIQSSSTVPSGTIIHSSPTPSRTVVYSSPVSSTAPRCSNGSCRR